MFLLIDVYFINYFNKNSEFNRFYGEKLLNNILTQKRFISSGPVLKDFHMVDIYLYDSSLFSNCLIIEDQDYTVIVDTGTSDTVNHILNYIHFNDINIKNVLIIPSHYHFDHAGGLKPLIDTLEKMRSNVTVVSTLKMKNKLTNTKDSKKLPLGIWNLYQTNIFNS